MNGFRFALFLSLASAAQAGTNGFVVPAFRGSIDSQAGYWETFSTAIGAPGNPPDKLGATIAARLTQSSPTAFLTGSGNIYNLDNASSFTLANAAPFAPGTVVLQTRTLGTELAYGGTTLFYTNETGGHSLAPVLQWELDRGVQPGLGATVSTLWQWNLTGLNISNYTVSFAAAAPSTSFDSMTVDISSRFAPVFTNFFSVNDTQPVIERWVYGNNAAPCDRPASSVFGTLGDDAGVDTRHAQHLLGWDTAAVVPVDRGPARYLLRHCRVTLTINRGNLFVYDPTQDDFRTYYDPNEPGYMPDSDEGRPIELFGAGFRNGFDATSFDQCAPFGTNAPGQRNAFAVGASTNGALVDVSNNVGKTNEAFPRFEVAPFAIGRTTSVVPGQLVPAGARIQFELNLEDPFVLAYLQDGLNRGRLRFMVTSLHGTAGQFGTPAYPDFATHFNEAILEPTRLELDGLVLRDLDTDADGLPDDWEQFHFYTLSGGAAGDFDGDGLDNLVEWRAGTNPANPASVLRVLSSSRDAAGRFTLALPHVANRRYLIESSVDFQTWTQATNDLVFRLGTGMAEWSERATGLGARFFRVRTE